MNSADKEKFLVEEVGLPRDVAASFLAGVEELSADSGVKRTRQVIKEQKFPGKTRVYVSQNWSNCVINWKTSLTGVVASLGTLASVSLSHPVGAVLAALQAYKAIVGVFEIEIKDEHARIVELLWLQHSGNPVALDELLAKAGDAGIAEHRCMEILSDLDNLGLVEVTGRNSERIVNKTDYIVL